MKKILFALCLLASFATYAQTPYKMPAVDKSPMDMTYFPANYPVLKIRDKVSEPLTARVIYSRPSKAGRTVFGDLVEFNQVWRLGANEATEIEFFREVRIGDRKVPKGKYTLYALVTPSQWTLILNSDTDTWGAFKYDEKKDAVRVAVPVEKLAVPVEVFSMHFEKTPSGTDLVIAWDEAKVALPISLK